jgi:hypothetical protein
MMKTNYLTPGYAPELAAQIRKTRPGQAHWASTGPVGATCGECVHLGYYRSTSISTTTRLTLSGLAAALNFTASPESTDPSFPSVPKPAAISGAGTTRIGTHKRTKELRHLGGKRRAARIAVNVTATNPKGNEDAYSR